MTRPLTGAPVHPAHTEPTPVTQQSDERWVKCVKKSESRPVAGPPPQQDTSETSLSQTPNTMAPEFTQLIEMISASAQTEKITLDDVQRAFDAVSGEEGANPPDIATFLEELVKAGVEVDEGIDEATLVATPEKVGKELAAAYEPSDLDAFSLFRAQALNHRILSRAEETELTHRYVLYARTARSLTGARSRLETKLADLRVKAARQGEILALLEEDSESEASLSAAPRALLDKLAASLTKLEAEAIRQDHEIGEAENAARHAETTFLSFNHRLVLALARSKWEQSGKKADLMDLVQQGELGMIDAFRKFDPTRGFKFSTFATWHINQKISEWTYEQVGSIRVPTHRWRDARKISQLRYRHFEAHGENPSIDEIADQMGKTSKKIVEILAAEDMGRTASLDKPISDEDGSATMGDLIADRSVLSPEQIAIREALRTIFREAFERILNARERRVLQLRFGIEDDVPHTLEWIGQRMKITRERVRQIEGKALQKLKADEVMRQMVGLDPVENSRPSFRPKRETIAF